jgi:hypothetical protein
MTRFNVLSLIVIALLFSSCSKVFKVAQIKSVDGLTVDDDRYVFENDTVKIIYDFWDEEGAMRYAIENKLDKPITIDWSKSHLVYRGENLPYWTNTERVKTAGRTSSWMGAYGASFWGLGSFTSNSVIQKQEKLSHIAGKSWIWKYDYRLFSITQEKVKRQIEGLENQRIPKKELKKIEKELRNDPLISSEMVNEEYEEKESPLQFRNSLELIIADSTESEKSSRVENSFYVSEMSSKPISTGINKKVYAEKSGTKIYSLRKNKNVIYPKNSVSISIGSTNVLRTALPYEVQIGYSRLIKPFFEVGLLYGAGGMRNDWYNIYYVTYPEGGKLELYHKIAASVNFIICAQRANRFSLGLIGYAQFRPTVKHWFDFSNGGAEEVKVGRRNIGGLQAEISGRFGTNNHSFIPFLTIGFDVENSSEEVSIYDQAGSLVWSNETTRIGGYNIAFGYGIRYSFNFHTKK